MNYAQIDENGVCVAVIEGSEAIIQDDFIPVEGDPISYIGRTCTGGVWSGELYIPPAPEPTIQERLEKLLPLADAISVTIEPSDRFGFDWKITRLADMIISKEYIQSGNTADGTADNPFNWNVGVALVPNAYYMYNGVRYVYMGVAGVATEVDIPDDTDFERWAEF